MRIRNFTKMGKGLQCCRSSPGEELQWKGEDLQCCKPSPLADLPPILIIWDLKIQHCTHSISIDPPPLGPWGLKREYVICILMRVVKSAWNAMLHIFRGKICNVADLPGRGEGLRCCRPSGGRKVCKGEGLQYNTGPNTDTGPSFSR